MLQASAQVNPCPGCCLSARDVATTWLPDAVVIVSMKRLPSGLMKLVVFWPSG